MESKKKNGVITRLIMADTLAKFRADHERLIDSGWIDNGEKFTKNGYICMDMKFVGRN
ncbi:hypothetical protein [Paenisporosarcina cavernae]|uniref:hypothetical protein n=1 Tax=Paenisporosarcina cavernae TaxID=2320858 RepID=UPI0013C4BEA1|nr:hypothetical protein [Paenisporosarcina cavernae]